MIKNHTHLSVIFYLYGRHSAPVMFNHFKFDLTMIKPHLYKPL